MIPNDAQQAGKLASLVASGGFLVLQIGNALAEILHLPMPVHLALVIILEILWIIGNLLWPKRWPGSGLTFFESVKLGVVLLAAGFAVWFVNGGSQPLYVSPMGMVTETRSLLQLQKDLHGYFLIHPQQPWNFTGIEVQSGQTISLTSSGQVHISIGHLVRAAEFDSLPTYSWVGPEGELDEAGLPLTTREDLGHPGRERCRLHTEVPYGALLLAIANSNSLSPLDSRRLEISERIFAPGDRFVVEADRPGFLHLGVNDVYVDQVDCDSAFVADKKSPLTFFVDNLGFFSVQIEVR